MPQPLDATRFASLLAPGMTVYAPGCAGHSLLFERWLTETPHCARGVEFVGVHIPGVNRFDFAALDSEARFRGFFLAPELRDSWHAGRLRYQPLAYSEIARWLAHEAEIDVALVQVTPPDAEGRCSLGIGCDFTPAALHRARRIVAHVNPRMPRTEGPTLDHARIDHAIEADTPLLEVREPEPDAALVGVARNVIGLLRDGDTIQLGLGKLQGAVLAGIHALHGLKLHAGMVSDPILGAIDAGVFAPAALAPITTGVALGSEALYRRSADASLFRFRAVDYTHDIATLRAIPNFVAINSALAVDLFGQVNAETVGGSQISGMGGLVDFLRGARLSRGGRAIVALPATAGRARESRIVPLLPAPHLVGVTRQDIDCVVTEHGVADLRRLDVDRRAETLIGIAAPEHRAALASAWSEIRAAA
jgi:acyl-CoA hydrolase